MIATAAESSTAMFCILMAVALGIFGGGAAFGVWAYKRWVEDDLVRLDREHARRQRLAEVYEWPVNGGGVA